MYWEGPIGCYFQSFVHKMISIKSKSTSVRLSSAFSASHILVLLSFSVYYANKIFDLMPSLYHPADMQHHIFMYNNSTIFKERTICSHSFPRLYTHNIDTYQLISSFCTDLSAVNVTPQMCQLSQCFEYQVTINGKSLYR